MNSESIGRKSSQNIPILQNNLNPPVTITEGEPITTISQQVLGINSSNSHSIESSSPSSKINAACHTSDTNSSESMQPTSTVKKRSRIPDNLFFEPVSKEGVDKTQSDGNLGLLSSSESNSRISIEKELNLNPKVDNNLQSSTEHLKSNHHSCEISEEAVNIKTSRKYLEVPKILNRKNSRVEFSLKVSNENKSRETSSLSRESSPRVSFTDSDEKKPCSQLASGRSILTNSSPRNNQEYVQKKIEKKVQSTPTVTFKVSCHEMKKNSNLEFHFNILEDLGVNFTCSAKLQNAELVQKAWKTFVHNPEDMPDEIEINEFKLSLVNPTLNLREEFWNILFERFYRSGFDGVGKDHIADRSNTEAGLMDLYVDALLVDEVLKHVPCLKIVEAMLDNNFAMDGWYLKLLFPHFFSKYNSAYFLATSSKICKYNIHIDDGSRFQIEKVKSLNIMKYGEEKKVATMTYTCVENFLETVQQPIYIIKNIDCKVDEDEYLENIMKIIANPADLPNSKKT